MTSKNVEEYKKLLKKWEKWVGAGQKNIPINSVWKQLIDLIDNHVCFMALNHSGSLMHEKNTYTKHYSSNSSFYRFILTNYVSYQAVGIRKLTEASDRHSTQSLSYLVQKMKKNSHKITREAFVTAFDYPYDYQEKLNNFHNNLRPSIKESAWVERPPAEYSRDRHGDFDRLSGKTKNQRKRNDLIVNEYWRNLEELLNIEEIKNITTYANNFAAHAGNDNSISKLSEKETKTSIANISKCHRTLIAVFKTIRMDFWDTEPFVAQTASKNIVFNMNNPFCDEIVQENTKDYIRDIKNDYESIKAISEF